MNYWGTLIFFFVVLAVALLYILKKRITDKEMKKDEFVIVTAIACLAFLFIVPLSLDIPSAVNGGQEVYTNELPTRYNFGLCCSFVETDNKELKQLRLGNWNKYEKYGDYRVRYTKFTKIVLDIEKLE